MHTRTSGLEGLNYVLDAYQLPSGTKERDRPGLRAAVEAFTARRRTEKIQQVLHGDNEWARGPDGECFLIDTPYEPFHSWCNSCGDEVPSAATWHVCLTCLGFDMCSSCQQRLAHPHRLLRRFVRHQAVDSHGSEEVVSRDASEVALLEALWAHQQSTRTITHSLGEASPGLAERLRHCAAQCHARQGPVEANRSLAATEAGSVAASSLRIGSTVVSCALAVAACKLLHGTPQGASRTRLTAFAQVHSDSGNRLAMRSMEGTPVKDAASAPSVESLATLVQLPEGVATTNRFDDIANAAAAIRNV